jgi:hypothetical protein
MLNPETEVSKPKEQRQSGWHIGIDHSPETAIVMEEKWQETIPSF